MDQVKGGLRLRGHIEDQFEIQTSFSQAAGNIQDGKNIYIFNIFTFCEAAVCFNISILKTS